MKQKHWLAPILGCARHSPSKLGSALTCMRVFYTSAGEFQQQSMAYSLDNGKTFSRYEGNPVIASTLADFRDPKVFYHNERMALILRSGFQRESGRKPRGSIS